MARARYQYRGHSSGGVLRHLHLAVASEQSRMMRRDLERLNDLILARYFADLAPRLPVHEARE
jgi:hypothetical protein